MKELIITIYVVGCLTACTMCDMVIEFNKDAKNPIIIPDDNERDTSSAYAIIFSLGSWAAVWYLWKFNKEEIKYTWRKWMSRK